MKTELLYGKDGISVEVPDYSFIIEPKNLPKLTNHEEAIHQALRNPIGAPPLKESVKSTDTVAIVISDITRPTPNHILVPFINRRIKSRPIRKFCDYQWNRDTP